MLYLGIFRLKSWKNHCHDWNQHPEICQVPKFCGKAKFPIFGTKNALFGYFWARILKKYCHIWNQCPHICLIASFWEKAKLCNFATKNALFGYFWDRELRTIVIFQVSILKYVKYQNFAKKQNFRTLVPKMFYLSIFGLEF